MSIDLIAFLRARLDEDEAAARAAVATVQPGDLPRETHIVYGLKDAGFGNAYQGFVLVHDPARVIREVEAGRARLALMIEATTERDTLLADKGAAVADQARAFGRAQAATVAAKWDAVVHIAHPDYMPEWKPPEGVRG